MIGLINNYSQLTMSTKPTISYTRDQIKEAIRAELKSSDFMGEDKERYYTVVGIVMAGLDKIDKTKTTTNDTTKGTIG